MGGIGKAIGRVISAPFKVVGNLLGMGQQQTASVSTPSVSAAQVVPSTAATAPEAPVLGAENTTQDKNKKRKKGKASLLIDKNTGSSSSGSSYSGLNI